MRMAAGNQHTSLFTTVSFMVVPLVVGAEVVLVLSIAGTELFSKDIAAGVWGD